MHLTFLGNFIYDNIQNEVQTLGKIIIKGWFDSKYRNFIFSFDFNKKSAHSPDERLSID